MRIVRVVTVAILIIAREKENILAREKRKDCTRRRSCTCACTTDLAGARPFKQEPDIIQLCLLKLWCGFSAAAECAAACEVRALWRNCTHESQPAQRTTSATLARSRTAVKMKSFEVVRLGSAVRVRVLLAHLLRSDVLCIGVGGSDDHALVFFINCRIFAFEPRLETIANQGTRALIIQQTCQGSFSAVSKSLFASRVFWFKHVYF